MDKADLRKLMAVDAFPEICICEEKMPPMAEAGTTAAVEQYLGELAGVRGDTSADPIVRVLLARSVGRLHGLCAALLHRSYPRLTQAPLNLQAEELLTQRSRGTVA